MQKSMAIGMELKHLKIKDIIPWRCNRYKLNGETLLILDLRRGVTLSDTVKK